MPARRTFGNTWWGQAWLDALEGRAVHDPNRLPRGRTYARKDAAGNLVIEPGRASARVLGSRPEPYDVLLTIREFRDDEWECVLDAIVAKAAHAAALLDGELAPEIVDDAREVEVEILPASGDLRTSCTCPDWAEPCKHAAAVCYLIADALDEDPFVLLTLRGLTKDEVLDAIRDRRASSAGPSPIADELDAAADDALEGVDGGEAWVRELGPLPSVPPAGPAPGRPAAWPSDPPRRAPFDRDGLRLLAADAARRAWAMRARGEPSHVDLDHATDLARRASEARDDEVSAMAFRSGVTPAALAAQAAAWELGGPGGVDMLDAPAWKPPVAVMAAARDRLIEAGMRDRAVKARSNRITVAGSTQFRYSPDKQWYRFAKVGGRWLLEAPPAEEIDDLIDLDLLTQP